MARPAFDANIADVVIYARYSSAAQNDQSIDGQLAKCHEYAEQRGFRVVGEYCDRALSGRHAETRPEFQRMIRDARKRAYKYILVWKLDRFARNRYDSAIYKKELKKYDVRVLSVTEGVDEGSESVLLEAILEAMAEEYSRQLAQNVRRGMRQNAEKAMFTGGHIPLGYDVADKRFIVNADEAKIVQYIHKAYAGGASQKEIAVEAAARGYRNKNGKPLTLDQIKRILRSDKYVGTYSFGDEVIIPNAFPAIIAPDLKAAVHRRLEACAKAPGRAKAKVEYLLQGKAFCGSCGAPLVGESGRSCNGATYNYYACAAKKKLHTCKKRNERKDALELFVVDYVCKRLLTEERIDQVAGAVAAEYAKSFDASGIKDLEKQIREADKELDQLVDALVKTSSAAALSRINDRISAIEACKATLEEDLAKLKIASRAVVRKQDVASWLLRFADGDSRDLDFQKSVIDIFVNAVYVYDDRIVMFFNVRDSEQVSYTEMLASIEEDSSDFGALGSPISTLFEQLIFRNGVFGCILQR